MARRRTAQSWNDSSQPTRRVNRCRALIVIDNGPLQAAAWAELVRARKRLEKAAHEVHRHEETDEPAFRAWIANTFPTLVSAARELAEQLAAKIRIVREVESEAFITGRDPGQIWRKWQRSGGRPPEPDVDGDETDDSVPPDVESLFEEEMKRMFAGDDETEEDSFAGKFRGVFTMSRRQESPPDAPDARATYRRLVQHLHPDRGGEWTPARARVWEQVQAAWAARDADWLARLEVEWEASADLLGPTSPIGKLRAALVEIDAARRDTEKRVRAYRKQPAWRFSLKDPSIALRTSLERQLRHDATMLRVQLDELEAVITRWTTPPARRRPRRNRRAEHWDFGL